MSESSRTRFTPRLIGAVGALLALSACDGTTTDPPRPNVSDPRQVILSDAALRTSADPNAPMEDSTWSAWTAANAIPIRSLTADQFPDLQFLKPLLAGKSLVQLGESGHGVAEFNEAKVRLVKFLHKEMGFDVIAFEADLHECYDANQRAGFETTLRLMQLCIYGVWHTEEVAFLFEYLRATASHQRPLTLAGFDMKPSTGYNTRRPGFIRKVAGAIDSAYGDEAARIDTMLMAALNSPASARLRTLTDSGQVLRDGYRTLEQYLDANAAAIVATGRVSRADVLVARQAARYAPATIAWATGSGASNPRDSVMADNVTFLLRELFPDRKIIVWAHNAHIRNSRTATRQSMGGWLAERHRPELYTVGLYMYRGRAADNSRQVYDVTPATARSLESIMYRSRWRQSFLDVAHQTQSAGNAWMFQSIGVKEWGRFPGTMVIRDEYDGILFVDSTRAPSYLVP